MKIQIPKNKAIAISPEITMWALRFTVVLLYVVLFVFKKKLYL